jgi:hypothetical protein
MRLKTISSSTGALPVAVRVYLHISIKEFNFNYSFSHRPLFLTNHEIQNSKKPEYCRRLIVFKTKIL